MKNLKALIVVLFSFWNLGGHLSKAYDGALEEKFKSHAMQFQDIALETLPVKDKGRLKPLDTFSREANLFLTGKKSLFGLKPFAFLLGLSSFQEIQSLKVINLRDVDLRKQLNLKSDERFFSLNEINSTNINQLAEKAMEIEKKNKNLLNSLENSQIELMNQVWLLSAISSGQFLSEALVYTVNGSENSLLVPLSNLFAVASNREGDVMMKKWANELLNFSKIQMLEPEFVSQRDKMGIEVFYNNANLFFWSGILYIIIFLICYFDWIAQRFSKSMIVTMNLLPLILISVGFGIRIYITEFPPVTNMYGTMIWVAFGIALFALLFYALYEDKKLLAILSVGAALLLLIAENIPLIISPSMDPIVAVLRSSYWLTIHVLTVTISYAALTISMVFGNVYLVKTILKQDSQEWIEKYSHYTYRSIQLGVFLLTVGIILGGVWADYSWGRFWGWDPKETCSLIADLGFLAILHSRFSGWGKKETVLFYSPLAYLLVVLAWFGVNFVLATGLHSYGFSSGGTFLVVAFFVIQLAIYGLYYINKSVRKIST